MRMRVCSSVNVCMLLEKTPFNIKHSGTEIEWSGMLKCQATGSLLLFPRIIFLCVYYAAILASGFHAFFLPVKVGVVEFRVLPSICLTLGGCLFAQRVVLLNKCLAAGMLLSRFHSFITALLLGTMVAW